MKMSTENLRDDVLITKASIKGDPTGFQTLEMLNSNLSKASAIPILNNKPITFSTLHSHRHHKRASAVQICDKVKKSQQKGIIFIWPQRRRFYYLREMSTLAWIFAHAFYWLYMANIFPSGSALPLPQPPWKYKAPLPKPENRDYIIEPDWDSQFA